MVGKITLTAFSAACRSSWSPPRYQERLGYPRVPVSHDVLDNIDRHSRGAQEWAVARARVAWRRARRAAAWVAGYQHHRLYRADLPTRGVVLPEGLQIDEFGQPEFDALSGEERAVLIERIEPIGGDEAYWRERWRCGDLMVLARLAGRPSGMTWCRRSPVMLLEVGRVVQLALSECYMDGGFVTPDARGKNILPAMLEDLGRRMAARDVHTAWTLIERANVASVRGVNKIGYALVADVVYTHVGPIHRLVVHPPDPAAKRLLGLP